MTAPTVDSLQLLTAAEVAGLCRMSVRWVEEQVAAGHLVAHRPGRLVRFSRADVAEFQASLRKAPKPQLIAPVIEMRRAG